MGQAFDKDGHVLGEAEGATKQEVFDKLNAAHKEAAEIRITENTPQSYHGGIGWAFKQMQNGSKVTRLGWNGKGQYLGLQVPDAHSMNTLPYVYIVTIQGQRVPWLCSQTDLLARDWALHT